MILIRHCKHLLVVVYKLLSRNIISYYIILYLGLPAEIWRMSVSTLISDQETLQKMLQLSTSAFK